MAEYQILFYLLSTIIIASLLVMTARFIGEAESTSQKDLLNAVKQKLGMGEENTEE